MEASYFKLQMPQEKYKACLNRKCVFTTFFPQEAADIFFPTQADLQPFSEDADSNPQPSATTMSTLNCAISSALQLQNTSTKICHS